MNSWLWRPTAFLDRPRFRLFCFSYAGGGPAVFRPWVARLPADVELVAIRLPGRESRLGEPLCHDWPSVVDETLTAMRPLLDVPFALVGHSFGGMLAYEITRALQTSHERLPHVLIVSGCRSSRVPPGSVAPYDSPSEVLWRWVTDLGGTPQAIVNEPEIRALVEPTLRADFKLVQMWPGCSEVIDAPIVTFGGSDDRIASGGDIAGWRAYTSRSYEHREFAGDHFFIHSAEADVVSAISSLCESNDPPRCTLSIGGPRQAQSRRVHAHRRFFHRC